ncbi:hypothetical protein AVEN_110655-1 [Araneus ventricosus]|uniref:DDE-1 domain-containing protein n=1 Tax=Araneus ventricosus TaxID=182803 RepID=A0A4Y2ATJ1_ARAVE|nr:hypothetical protein AVEN_110655-1 [Araneus ventricosus]
MDQGLIESMKRRYRKQLLSKLLFEGDGDEEEAACSIVKFWKALTLKDCVYMINEAWNGSVTVTELNGILQQIPGCGNCEEDHIDCDADGAGFQLMSDDEIIAKVRKRNGDDNNNESDEDVVIETSKISNSDAFAKGGRGNGWSNRLTLILQSLCY